MQVFCRLSEVCSGENMLIVLATCSGPEGGPQNAEGNEEGR